MARCPAAAPCWGPSGGVRSTTPAASTRSSATFNDLGIDALIVVGGNGSLTVAHALAEEEGLPIVGVPKTIDNDVVGTDMTFGFHTAVQIATEAIDRLHTTAESHDRVMVVEVMGRHSGGSPPTPGSPEGASVVLIPEIPFDIEKVCVHLPGATRRAATRRSSSSPRAPSRSPARSRSASACTTSSATSVSVGSPT